MEGYCFDSNPIVNACALNGDMGDCISCGIDLAEPKTTCHRCQSSLYLNRELNKCVSNCEPFFRDVEVDGFLYCEKCHSSCYTCQSNKQNSCIRCPTGYSNDFRFVTKGVCYKDCPVGKYNTFKAASPSQYEDESDPCGECPEGCTSCVASDACTLCKPGYEFYYSLCVPIISNHPESLQNLVPLLPLLRLTD